MPRRRPVRTALLLALAVGLTVPAAALAQDTHGDVAPAAQLVLRQRLAGVLNPMGAEHYAELAARSLLGDQESLFFMGAHIEIGAVTALSPVYAVGGGYLELSPLSFLVLRGQLTGQAVWPIGMSGAGHYALDGYDADVSSQALPAEAGGKSTGWNASVAGTLQGMIPLGSARLLFLDELALEYAELGSAPFYYDQRNDLVRARADWLVANGAFLGIELDIEQDVLLRVGVYDDLRHVPAADYVANQIGPLAMLAISRPHETIASIEPFIRAGYYTHHHLREGQFTVLGGLQVRYDLCPTNGASR